MAVFTKEKIRKILIVNTFGIGDVLFTTPLLRNIKENLPGCFIAFVCNERAKGILVNNPHLNRIFVFEKDYYRELASHSRLRGLGEFLIFLNSIKREKFDLVIDLTLSSQVSFFLWLLAIKIRVGFNFKKRGWLLTDSISMDGYAEKHVVEFYLDLLRFMNLEIHSANLEIFTSPAEDLWVSDFLESQGVFEKDFLIAVIPAGGSSWGKDAAIKHWPAENFAQVADKCRERFKAKIIILGDSAEMNICKRVFDAVKEGAVQACGMTDLGQLCALLRRCNLVITNDGGPLHVAVASGAKTVSLFGPVDEKVYGPFPPDSKRHRVVRKELNCRPCYRRFKMPDCSRRICLDDISVDEVLKSVEALL